MVLLQLLLLFIILTDFRLWDRWLLWNMSRMWASLIGQYGHLRRSPPNRDFKLSSSVTFLIFGADLAPAPIRWGTDADPVKDQKEHSLAFPRSNHPEKPFLFSFLQIKTTKENRWKNKLKRENVYRDRKGRQREEEQSYGRSSTATISL